MLKITYAVPSTLINVEGKFNLSIKRERKDLEKLLNKLKNGESLYSLFPSKPVENAVARFLTNQNYIDSQYRLTSTGELTLKKPLFLEKETGIYSLDISNFSIKGKNYSMVTNLKRTLSSEKRPFKSIMSYDFSNKNQIIIDNKAHEKVFLEAIQPYQDSKQTRVFESTPKESTVTFNLVNNQYKFGDTWLECGDEITEKILDFLEDLVSNNRFGFINIKEKHILINTLADLSEDELKYGELSLYTKEGLTIENLPIKINDAEVAKQYAYLYAYYKLSTNTYLNLNELNEMFQNDILSKDTFSTNLKQEMATFQFSMTGFKKYLSREKYSELSYKLEILNYLLNTTIYQNEFSKAKSYGDLVNAFIEFVNPVEVSQVYLVMGYPFARNPKNEIIHAIASFKKAYPKLTIVEKGNVQTKDMNLRKSIEEMGVKVKEKPEIITAFHDRYILFATHNGTYRGFLVTCEYGQFFSKDTHSTMGSIVKIDPKELQKNKLNLIEIVEA